MSTYGAKLRARLDLRHTKQFGQVGMQFPESFYEEIFQAKVTGGYDKNRDGTCNRCFQVRSRNGACGCEL
jgi:hypothetical protein